MDLERIFHDLESNKQAECEEAKRKLAEYLSQNKEQWVVQFMMEYFLKTGSLRIGEVLIKVQTPHDNYIFDRLADWLKVPTHRLPAINFFSFVIRKHPTWLYKVEKHRLIRDIFRLFQTEREIVLLMSALLCIVTLLPIIPNSVPNFLNDLFDVFGCLASWNCDKTNSLTDDKLVHLQLGLQMLFHRLYGMYPCNFMAFLSDFIKKEKDAIFIHTIKPLLETVRVHPLLLTATASTEVSSSRWKEIEPHDVVIECASVTLPVLHQDLHPEAANCNPSAYALSAPQTPKYMLTQMQPVSWFDSSMDSVNKMSAFRTAIDVTRSGSKLRWDDRHFGAQIAIWSPYDEFSNNTGPIPVTPNPPYMLPMSTASASNVHQLIGLTGSSPPEAAVEATPETTPMKDISKDSNHQSGKIITGKFGGNISNPNAVRAIFASSQPSSPMRKEQNLFHFPDNAGNDSTYLHGATGKLGATTFVEHEAITARYSTNYDKNVQRVLRERTHSQSILQTIEAQAEAVTRRGRLSPNETSSKSETPDIESDTLGYRLEDLNAAQTQTLEHTPTPMQTHAHTPTPIENITKTCSDCNETDHTRCTAGGLHTATDRTMHKMLKELKRRHRMASYSCNNSSCDKNNDNNQNIDCAIAKVRRTKSCSSISSSLSSPVDWPVINPIKIDTQQQERRLQKSSKMLSIATASKTSMETEYLDEACQTIEPLLQNYENSLFLLLSEHRELHRQYECKLLNPHQILDQFIMSIMSETKYETAYRFDQEQLQLICLQLQYERYRRDIHAERNRRLMGRSRIKRNLEMERDTLREQLCSVANIEKTIVKQLDEKQKAANAREQRYIEELTALKSKYQNEVEHTKRLKLENENLQTQLKEQLASRREINYELEVLRGQIFDLNSELKQAQVQIDIGLQCKQELARLEAEFIIMGEVQVKCKERLSEVDNLKAREDEMQMIQEAHNKELKKVKHELEDKTSHLDSARHKIIDLQAQLLGCEKVITEQKRLLKTVKDEYEERFKALNKKYEIQKIILMQMEEKIASLHRPTLTFGQTACSPDIDKTDVASSMERNSPLSTSLASSESLSMSLRSSEMRNLQQLAEANTNQIASAVENPRLSSALESDSSVAAASTTTASLNQRR